MQMHEFWPLGSELWFSAPMGWHAHGSDLRSKALAMANAAFKRVLRLVGTTISFTSFVFGFDRLLLYLR